MVPGLLQNARSQRPELGLLLLLRRTRFRARGDVQDGGTMGGRDDNAKEFCTDLVPER